MGEGKGCSFELILLATVGIIILLAVSMGGGGSKAGVNSTSTSTESNTRSGTASGNQVEVMSRNQLNLWSDVQNCYGDASCITVISTTESTASQVRTETTITGDRNFVIGSDGTKLCEDPVTKIMTSTACQ